MNNVGVYLSEAGYNLIKGNNVFNNLENGISISQKSNYNSIIYNLITENDVNGVHLYDSHYNEIDSNNMSWNDKGIYIDWSSNYNTISQNNISRNSMGIYFSMASYNTIYHNNFLDNAQQARDEGNNTWDNGYPDGGNYWSDYYGLDLYSGPGQNISGSDGIGDTSYSIPGGDCVDNYPLKWTFPDLTPPMINLVGPSNNSYVTPGIIINLEITDFNLNISHYSHNGGENQSLSSPYDISTTDWIEGIHIIEVTANDTFYNIAKATFRFFVDTTSPIITLISPPDNSVILPGDAIEVKVTETNLSYVEFSVDGGLKEALSSPFNINTVNWTDGSHILEIYATDLAGNTAVESFIFTVDSEPPSISLISPLNNTIISPGTNIELNVIDLHYLDSSIR